MVRLTTATVTVASAARRDHLDVQLSALAAHDVLRVVVWLEPDAPGDMDADELLVVAPGPYGFRLGAARNAGAERAIARGASVIVFLDADCVPGPDLVSRYVLEASRHPDSVLSGPVTYLPAGVDARDGAQLEAHRAPHPARPAPLAGAVIVAGHDDYALFWSLSFAVSATRWKAGPHFDERYEGYGAEDTDLGFRLRASDVPLLWVGGADAYHQHHPTSSPPVQHVDDILRNGRLFAETWNEWPMSGWLEAFEGRGLVARTADGWGRADSDVDSEADAS